MSKIILDITMSLDGFVAGPSVSNENPLGIGGLRLHEWIFSAKTPVDEAAQQTAHGNAGAVIVGGHTYETAINDAWDGKTPFEMPAFVLIKDVPAQQKEGFTYVTQGITAVLDKARAKAGDKDIWVMGGASMIQQFIAANLYDQLHLHIAPVLLGEGLRLFENIGTKLVEFKNISVTQSPQATHLVLGKPY